MYAWARRARSIATLVAATVGLANVANAQGYFGQNHVQYDRLKWRVIETEHFLLHYYPEIEQVAPDAARMAERSYARLSRLFGHQFREKKPILLFGSSGDFAQSNVFGDLGEGTGGVTDALRQRMAQFMTGDYGSFEHVFQHEMVHVFQYDIFSRGRAGAGLQNFAQVNPPLWLMEGLAEYFSIGPKHAWTDAVMRDAALNGNLPTIEVMTERPNEYFPYRYGLSLLQYVGSRWGDEVIGEIFNAIPSVGVERAFRRELGLSLEELSDEWHESLQNRFLPNIAQLDRPRKFGSPMLNAKRSGGIANSFVAPALSNDGSRVVFVGYGSFLKGEVFPDLYLADAQTGKRIARLIKSTTNADFEQLRFIYSQPSFAPDGKSLAFTGQRRGKDVLYLMDVRKRDVTARFDNLGMDQVLSPAWSPDGKQLVFSGLKGGISDLYVVNRDGSGLKKLTDDKFGDAMAQWSPDGKTIAFASDRGDDTDFEILKVGKWKISLLDVASGKVSVLPNQRGLSINPQWAPDGQSLIFVNDRTGTQNLFLYDLRDQQHYQLTNVVGAISAIAEYSPAISWAREADVLALVYYEKGDNTVWSIRNPRLLKKQPYRDSTMTLVAQSSPTDTSARAAGSRPAASSGTAVLDLAQRLIRGTGAGYLPTVSLRDTTGARRSYYRSGANGTRLSGDLAVTASATKAEGVTIAALMDSFDLNLPDSTGLRDYRYKVRFQPEYIAQPQIGYQNNGFFGNGVFGGTTIVLSDLLGDHRLAFTGGVNGQLSDAQLFAGYTSLGRRFQFNTGISQQPIYLAAGQELIPIGGAQFIERTSILRYVFRDVFFSGLYPLDRFRRFELTLGFQNIDQQIFPFERLIDGSIGAAGQSRQGRTQNIASANNLRPSIAYVSDNSLFGWTGPLSGKRLRLQASAQSGTWQFMDYLADYRRYDPILFGFLTVATRLMTSQSVGRDERIFPKWIGRPDFIRGFSRELYGDATCETAPGNPTGCSATQLLGSRVAIGNVELRFPLLRQAALGLLPVGLPPIEAALFYDAGMAWQGGQALSVNRPANYDWTKQRFLLRSWGYGVRMNLFNFAFLRYEYAYPMDQPGRRPFGTWFFGPSF
jgi:dipeptidyl aminopeptidase/acylaminoacyl peptidase